MFSDQFYLVFHSLFSYSEGTLVPGLDSVKEKRAARKTKLVAVSLDVRLEYFVLRITFIFSFICESSDRYFLIGWCFGT